MRYFLFFYMNIDLIQQVHNLTPTGFVCTSVILTLGRISKFFAEYLLVESKATKAVEILTSPESTKAV